MYTFLQCLSVAFKGNNVFFIITDIMRYFVVIWLTTLVGRLAAQTHPFAEGAGTEAHPFQINTPAQLDSIRDNSAEGGENYLAHHYVLTANLDFASYNYEDDEKGWNPIGNGTNPFEGTLNGKGYVVNNLFIDRPNEDYIGLFGSLGSASKLDSMYLEDIAIIGQDRVGGMAGYANGTIIHSYAFGEIVGTNTVGGMIGYLNEGNIEGSYATGQVTGTTTIGGMVGYLYDGNIEDSYATGQVTGGMNVGGLVGWNAQGAVSRSYAAGQVTGTSSIGGLVGKGAGTFVTSSYWNTETSGQTTSIGGTKLTTTEMYTPSEYAQWAFYDATNNPSGIWNPPSEGQRFPQLRSVSKNAQVLAFRPITPSGVNTTLTLNYILIPPTLSEANLTLESSSPSVATVNENRQVTTMHKGTTTLTIRRAGNDSYIPISISQELTVFDHPFAGGSGTATHPFRITTPQQMDSIRDHSSHNGDNYLDDHYMLMNDLNLSDYEYTNEDNTWLPLGHDTDKTTDDFQGTPFTGTFNGRGHTVHNVSIDRPDEDYIGLFGYLDNASRIDSLGLNNAVVTGRKYVGGLAGHHGNNSIISKSHATGQVTGGTHVGGMAGYNQGRILDSDVDGQVMGTTNVGGLTGYSTQDTIRNSHATGQVLGSNAGNIGGLVGFLSSGVITESHASSQVMGETWVGGLTGYSDQGTIENSYATGQVEGADNIGGLLGGGIHSMIINSYAVGQVTGNTSAGGLMGKDVGNSGTVTSSYWNTQTTEQPTSAGGNSLTTEEMYLEKSFDSWDFAHTWSPPIEDEHFPQLRGVNGNAQLLVFPSIAPKTVSHTFTLEYTLLPLVLLEADNLTEIAVMFKSSDTDIATIDATGEVTTKGVGAVTLTIQREGNDDYVPTSLSQELEIAPPPRVMITADPIVLLEGTRVTFTLTRMGDVLIPLSVEVEVTQTGDYTNAAGSHVVVFSNGSTAATLTIDTEDDDTDEPDGTITATVMPGAGYQIGVLPSVTVSIADNDEPEALKVSIEAQATEVTEGDNAAFTLTRTRASGTLSVNVDVTQTGDYTNATGSHVVDFSDGATTATLTIATEDDDTDEPNGTVTATVMPGMSYEPGAMPSATVSIADNDEPEAPKVSIEAQATEVTEGENAMFTLTRTRASGTLSANVEVTQTGNYTNATGSHMVDFSDGAMTATLTIATEDDDTDEPNGTITATVMPGMSYEVDASSSATISITDNDDAEAPEVSIETQAEEITEGENAVFTLTRTRASGALSANVEVTQTGDYTTATGSHVVDFSDGSTTATLTIATEKDEKDEPNGTITATVMDGMGYTTGTPSTAMVTIADDDSPLGTVHPEYVTVYPNPTNRWLHLRPENEDIKLYEIAIYNMAGQRLPIKQKHTKHLASIDLLHLPDGLYIIKLSSPTKATRRYRIVKRK